MRKITLLMILISLMASCSKEKKADGYGFFEADQVIVSAETQGKIIYLDLEEAESVYQGNVAVIIDTNQAFLNKVQIDTKKLTVASQANNVLANTKVLKEQLRTAEQDLRRISNLHKEKAATDKQLDDARGRVNVIVSQIEQVSTQNSTIMTEIASLNAQKDIVSDQLRKSVIRNPLSGTVLVKYVELGELAVPGKALYKVANLSEMDLNVYLTLNQLTKIKLGRKVIVVVDNKDNDYKYEGIITKISDKAEFTPKIIQTKEERENQVYKVTVRVKNDGRIKIGMPGSIYL